MRAASRGLQCDLSTRDLREMCKASDQCPICDTAFVDDENHESARSFDRLDSREGYMHGNVHVICRNCNSVKSLFDEFGSDVILKHHHVLGRMVLDWVASKLMDGWRTSHVADDR